jgi:hypothetical protein
MEPVPEPLLSTEAHCTLACLGLKEALKNMHRATKAYELEPAEDGATSLRALRDLVWVLLPEMADVIADQLGYQAGKDAA